jgi:hypothetical protein
VALLPTVLVSLLNCWIVRFLRFSIQPQIPAFDNFIPPRAAAPLTKLTVASTAGNAALTGLLEMSGVTVLGFGLVRPVSAQCSRPRRLAMPRTGRQTTNRPAGSFKPASGQVPGKSRCRCGMKRAPLLFLQVTFSISSSTRGGQPPASHLKSRLAGSFR